MLRVWRQMPCQEVLTHEVWIGKDLGVVVVRRLLKTLHQALHSLDLFVVERAHEAFEFSYRWDGRRWSMFAR